jgi:uncharacterized protein YndB with AHSA1/START domain
VAVSLSLLSPSARADHDPWSARVRVLAGAPLATFQGVDCVSVQAPRSVVWRLLVAPEYAATWFFANSPLLKARGARYKKGPTADRGDTLSLEATTAEGPRHLDLFVLVASPPDLLSFVVRSDDGNLLDKGLERLSFSFSLESAPDGVTDVYLASHYDSDSPFSALLSPAAARRQGERRRAILEMFRALAEEAARQKYPPLHEVVLTAPTPGAYKTLPPRK